MSIVSIFIISSEHSPARFYLDGLTAVCPVGRDVDLDERLMPLLRDTPGIVWRYTGEALPEADARHEGPGPDFDALSIIDGNVDEVAARLSALTPEQLLSVRAAEEGGATRKGVLAAINRAFDAINEDNS